MNLKLETKYLGLENSRNRLLDELEGLDDEQLNTSVEEGKWSIVQHLAHVLLVDKSAMDYVLYKLEHAHDLPAASLSNAIKSLALKLALRSGKKYAAPPAVAAIPSHVSLTALRHEWDDNRFQLEDVLTDFPDELLDRCIFKHPHVGPLTISQTLTFLQDHFDHHLRAIRHIQHELLK
ncbi:DinB family protein [Pontibacter sp. E15-1]|uniref:DinB family protein n=1 Tax=Pontibacter sp. E15-1 TaxID=2919918 RepID=UPI001F501743|nr:DinB family protein [Pontibacter sp. E15-1]MCJ8166383.1 DinB family protein [Pontibacter sp. E15-1]